MSPGERRTTGPGRPTAGPDRPTLVVGEALVDVLTDGQGGRRASPGGSPANVALGLARLGLPVRLATRTGDDVFGELVRRHLWRDGVELVGGVADGRTATATVTLDPHGNADYAFDLHWELPDDTVALLREQPRRHAHLHTGSLAATLPPGAEQVLAAVLAARPQATVSYDPNLRPVLLGEPAAERAGIEALVAAADLVKASEEDLAWLYPELGAERAAAEWVRRGPALVVLTRGGDGAKALWRHGSCEVAALPVTVLDTVGAGDAFMAGLLAGLLGAGLLGDGAGGGGGERGGGGEGGGLLGGGGGGSGGGVGDGGSPPSGRTALLAATSGSEPSPQLTAALALAARAAAATCGRLGADPPTRAELDALGTSDGGVGKGDGDGSDGKSGSDGAGGRGGRGVLPVGRG
ncbi:carbohydrate kinase family protein [Streptacidiphilus cavernicola]|uniref:Carbohydrate kinase n=1 Tax=Streptacidiphilus cavernicola TaxID=3342716 RepID=A0ABV6VPB4_9ACTN